KKTAASGQPPSLRTPYKPQTNFPSTAIFQKNEFFLMLPCRRKTTVYFPSKIRESSDAHAFTIWGCTGVVSKARSATFSHITSLLKLKTPLVGNCGQNHRVASQTGLKPNPATAAPKTGNIRAPG
ncbi:hypothetical protein, partial [Hoeflea prorocentri]